MDKAQKFSEKIFTLEDQLFSMEAWDKCKVAYDENRYIEAINQLICYINPTYKHVDFNKENEVYTIKHGSMMLTAVRKGTQIHISAPFLKLPPNPSVALLRQIVEINFFDLIMPQIILKNGVLTFEAAFDVELGNPYMLYDLLHNICYHGDHYDDLFVDKFKATRVMEPNTQGRNPAEIQKAFTIFQEMVAEGLEYTNFFEQKRWNALMMDNIWISFYKISRTMRPQGLLGSDIRNSISALKANVPFDQKVEQARKNLEKLKSYSMEKFTLCMEKSEYFISDKRLAKGDQINNIFKPYFDSAKAEREKSDFHGSTLSLLVGYYTFLHYYKGENSTDVMLENGLRMAGGKPWKEASDILFTNLSTVLQTAGAVQEAQGIMSQLFNFDLSKMIKAVSNG